MKLTMLLLNGSHRTVTGGGVIKVTKKNKILHSWIHNKFTTETECALVLAERFPEHHWSKSKLNKYTNGTVPGVFEVNDLAIVLEKKVEDVLKIFLQHQSPNGDAA